MNLKSGALLILVVITHFDHKKPMFWQIFFRACVSVLLISIIFQKHIEYIIVSTASTRLSLMRLSTEIS
jgi:hypothetical protein